MNTFSGIKELFSALKKEENLLSEMFKKRKSVNFKYEYALEIAGDNENRIKYLLDREVIRQNGNDLEIDDLFLQFFEQVLDANEEINISYINDSLEKIIQNIKYYLNETNENRKYDYLRKIKTTLRNIGNITLRNIIDLKRNVDNTFKNEPNYKNKKEKLINLDKKRKDVVRLIEQTLQLVSEREATFFTTAIDEELGRIIILLKLQLAKCTHNLIEIERQIIDFLNQIQYQSSVIEQLRKIKYLKDQFILETATDFRTVMANDNPVIFESKPQYPLKLSLGHLQADEDAFEIIKKIARRITTKVTLRQPIADKISNIYLQTLVEEEVQINLEDVKNGFMASSYSLLDFIFTYNFSKEVSFEDLVTIYCQLISQYETEFEITDRFQQKDDVEFAIVYPK